MLFGEESDRVGGMMRQKYSSPQKKNMDAVFLFCTLSQSTSFLSNNAFKDDGKPQQVA